MIVLAVFGILMVAASSFLIQVVQNGNRVAIENEVRQNGQAVIGDIISRGRTASCVYFYQPPGGAAVLRLSNSVSGTGCNGGDRIEYQVDSTGVVTRKEISQSGVVSGPVTISSPSVAVLDCSGGVAACRGGSCVPGLAVSGNFDPVNHVLAGQTATVTLSLQQPPGVSRSDFCAAMTLVDSVTPRML